MLFDEDEGRRRRRRKLADPNEKPKLITTDYIPNSMKRLRACLFCKLVLNVEKWRKLERCPNCEDSRGQKDTTD